MSHVFFGLLEQKLFRKTKGRQIKSQGCTSDRMKAFPKGEVAVLKKGTYFLFSMIDDILRTYQSRLVVELLVAFILVYQQARQSAKQTSKWRSK